MLAGSVPALSEKKEVIMFSTLIDRLSDIYVERREVITAIVAAIIARCHVALIGPPGTAKSSLVRALAAGLGDLNFFSWQLTEFSVPDELFGPLDIVAFEGGHYCRRTAGKLPEADLAFLDEVFKAGPAILNTLLSIMQERLFHDDPPRQCPLISIIGAANEVPTERELAALWDRFTVRLLVGYIREPANFIRMLTSPTDHPVERVLSRADLVAAQEAAAKVTVPEAVLYTYARLHQALLERGIEISDRRYKESLRLLRARAFLDGRSEVTEEDLLILQHVFWHDPAQAPEVARLVFAVAEPVLVGITEIENEALAAVTEARQLIAEGASGTAVTQALFNTVAGLREAVQKLKSLEPQVIGRSAAAAALEAALKRVEDWQRELLGTLGVL